MSQKRIHPSSSRGSALLVAIVLLLLAGLMALLAMNVGVFEQRSSGNDLRAKVVNQVAEAGIAQGFEFLYRANQAWIDDNARWELCNASDLTFPCGAVPAARRGSMYRLRAGSHTVNGLDVELTRHMLPLPAALPASGALDVAYGVAPVLCRLPSPLPPPGAISCAIGMGNISDRRVVTFVSVAQVRGGDSGRTTLTQTIARSSLLGQGAGVPSVAASGSVVPPGNGDVVAMPDAGGPGLDLSIWSRLDILPASGSFATCSRADFLASDSVSLNDPDWVSTRTCDKCTCGMAKKASPVEDWDILDNEGASTEVGINKNVRAGEFPCDMFEYVFNVKAWQDGASATDDGIMPLSGDNDGFCERRMPMVDFETPSGAIVQLPPDEAFLYTYARYIRPTTANAALVRADQLIARNLGASDSGLVWCQVDCLPNGGFVASVASPIVVVADAGTNTPYHAKLFGILFFKSTGNANLDPVAGGNASMRFNAGSAVYGAVVVQGSVLTGSGGGLIFGDKDVLINLTTSPSLSRFDTLRGGWTDRHSY